jgi:hypothetical protein
VSLKQQMDGPILQSASSAAPFLSFKLCQLTSPVNCERGEMSNANETQVIGAKGACSMTTLDDEL